MKSAQRFNPHKTLGTVATLSKRYLNSKLFSNVYTEQSIKIVQVVKDIEVL